MLLLLMQITTASEGPESGNGICGPWTEYVRLLPRDVPLPTMWKDEERELLAGTSLEVIS
jgi:hypothetical protein